MKTARMGRFVRSAVLAGLVLALVASVCGSSAGAASGTGRLWGHPFATVSFERQGREPVAVRHTRFWFTRHRGPHGVRESVGWYDGCNWYGGWMRVRGHTMHAWGVAGTAIACVRVDKNGKPVRERGPILMNFISGTLHWRLHGTHLSITRGRATLRLREVPR